MRFFRRSLSLGSVVLLAVAMQAAVLMAQMHVHAHSHGAASLYAAARAAQGPGARAWAKSVIAYTCRAAERDACPPVDPHDHRNDCPMCWSLAVVGSGVLPAPAPVSLEAPRHQTLIPLRVVDRVPVRAGANFQARAPPIV
jgi:hypothetical protein